MQAVADVAGMSLTASLTVTIEISFDTFDINGNWVGTFTNGMATNNCATGEGVNETIVIQYSTQTNTINHFTYLQPVYCSEFLGRNGQ